MMAKLIFILSIFLLGHSFSLPQTIKPKPMVSVSKNQAKAFYEAAQTGEKAKLSSKTKDNLKRFGLIHLLTPSGIHLSSILGLFLFLFNRKYKFIFLLGTLIFFYNFPELQSLRRVLYFQIIILFLKGPLKIKQAFILTFILDLLLGGYSSNPLSYSFSFIFWGLIIYSRTKLQAAINLFLAQLLVVFISQTGSVNLLAIVINPVFTAIYSFLFPLFSLNYWLGESELLTQYIIHFHFYYLKTISWFADYFKILSITSHPFILLLPFLLNKLSRPTSLSLLLLIPLSLNPLKKETSGTPTKFISLHDKDEIKKITKTKIYFYEIECRRKFKGEIWELKCKKKPSKYGGPSI